MWMIVITCGSESSSMVRVIKMEGAVIVLKVVRFGKSLRRHPPEGGERPPAYCGRRHFVSGRSGRRVSRYEPDGRRYRGHGTAARRAA